MAKVRVHQVAKEAGVAPAQAVQLLRDAGFSVTSHASGVDRDAALLVLRDRGEATAEPKERPARGRRQRRQRRRGGSEGGSGTVVIKKYGNRRLYSTESSRYLTLDELEELVRSGRKVQVLDASSGEDLTSQVLTQILLEGGRARRFPVAFLEEIIRLGDDALQTFFGRYLMTGLDMFLAAQREMERRYQQSLAGFSMWPFPGFGNSAGDWPGAASSAAPPPSPPPADSGDSEVERLRQRLEQLEREVINSRSQDDK